MTAAQSENSERELRYAGEDADHLASGTEAMSQMVPTVMTSCHPSSPRERCFPFGSLK